MINIFYIILTFYFWLHPSETFGAIVVCTIVSFLAFLIEIIFTCVSVILGIINFVKKNNKKLRYKIIIMLIILILLSISPLIITNIQSINDNKKQSQMQLVINDIVEKINNQEENQYVYFLEDLQKLDKNFKISPMGNEYDKGSYITNYEGKIYVCLSDGKWTTKGYIDDQLKITKTTESCKYGFSLIISFDDKEIKGTEGELYLEYYYKKNYGIKVKANSNIECSFTSCNIVDYTIKTTNGEYKVNLKVEDNKIEVVNDFYGTLKENDKVILKLNGYIDNIDGLSNAHTNDNDEFLYLNTSLDKEKTLKYTKDLINFLKSEFNTDINIIIGKYTESENDNFLDVDITPEYAIYIVIKNGESKVYYTNDSLDNIIEFKN